VVPFPIRLLVCCLLLLQDARFSLAALKYQTGIRIDRVLYKQFQGICSREKLRPGEAVESLIRLAVQADSITGVSITTSKSENTVRMFDDALFKSRLERLKASLELEEKYWKETGREVDEKDSEFYVGELTLLGRRNVSPELVKEFEALLTDADKQYQEMQKTYYEKEINEHKT